MINISSHEASNLSTKYSRMLAACVYINDSECAHEDTSSRSREGSSAFFDGYLGLILADGYADYNECCDQNNIQHVASWAHVLRKLFDAPELLSEPGKPQLDLSYNQKLYGIELKISGLNPEQNVQAQQLKVNAVSYIRDLFVQS